MSRYLPYSAFVFFLVFVVPSQAGAAVVWDYSPDHTGATVKTPWYTNKAADQHLAEKVVFAKSTTLQAMDIYSSVNAGFVGQTVVIQIWEDDAGEPGGLLHEFEETVSIIDSEGTESQNFMSRKHASFSAPVALTAGTYWVGMSSAVLEEGLGQGTLDNVDDNHVAFFSGDAYVNIFDNGDMAFRLHGPTVSFRGNEYSVTSFEFGESISGVDYDPDTGHLFMVDDRDAADKTDMVYETDVNGSVVNSFPVPGAPYPYLRGLSVDDGTITLVTNRAILQMDTSGGGFSERPMPDGSFNDFSGITYSSAANEYYISRGGRGVYVTDADFNPLSLIDTPALGYNSPAGLDYDLNTDTLLIMDDSPDDLLEMDLDGTVLDSIWLLSAEFPSPIHFLTSVAVDPDSGTLYLAGRLYDNPFKIVVMTPISAPLSPIEQLGEIQDFFADSMADGSLVGATSSPRLNNVLLSWLQISLRSLEWLIARDLPLLNRIACRRISFYVRRVDGDNSNWSEQDWVAGEAAPDLYDMMLDLEESLGCGL